MHTQFDTAIDLFVCTHSPILKVEITDIFSLSTTVNNSSRGFSSGRYFWKYLLACTGTFYKHQTETIDRCENFKENSVSPTIRMRCVCVFEKLLFERKGFVFCPFILEFFVFCNRNRGSFLQHHSDRAYCSATVFEFVIRCAISSLLSKYNSYSRGFFLRKFSPLLFLLEF